MPKTPLFPLPDGLEITSASQTPEALLVRVTSTRSSSPCPLCATPSRSIHSYYRRMPADLPCVGRRVTLLLTVRKFFCRLKSCPRKVFTERLPDLLEPSSRLAKRLRMAVQTRGCITTAQGGASLTKALGMPISATSMRRSLHLLPMLPIEGVRVVSLDEWAWKRGRRYGTIIVDLEHHQVLDLLAENSKEAAQAWLQQHPDIEVVGRDRGGTYADAATWGAPLAVQVADRWHLCVRRIGACVDTFQRKEGLRAKDL